MMDKLPQYQEIEDAYKAPADVIGRLPEGTTEARRASEHLDMARRYTYEARERAKADRTEAVPADSLTAMVDDGPEFIVLPAQDSTTPGHTHDLRRRRTA